MRRGTAARKVRFAPNLLSWIVLPSLGRCISSTAKERKAKPALSQPFSGSHGRLRQKPSSLTLRLPGEATWRQSARRRVCSASSNYVAATAGLRSVQGAFPRGPGYPPHYNSINSLVLRTKASYYMLTSCTRIPTIYARYCLLQRQPYFFPCPSFPVFLVISLPVICVVCCR